MLPTIEKHPGVEERFISAFEMNQGHTLNGSNAAISSVRQQAIERFAALGVPTRKNEAWKYTNIEQVLKQEYTLQLGSSDARLTDDDIEAFRVPGLDAHLVVFLNGRFSAAHSRIDSLPDGVLLDGFQAAGEQHASIVAAHFAKHADVGSDALVALNTAFAQDGLFLYVPAGVALERPVEVVHVINTSEHLMMQPRSLYIIEENARATVIETFHSRYDTRVFTNRLTEVSVGARAVFEHYQVQQEGSQASQVNSIQVTQGTHSNFSTLTLTTDGAVMRNNVGLRLNAEHCESHLYGLYLGNKKQHIDIHTFVDHAMPHCYSNELYKGVLDDRATGVFNGKIMVREDAQKTNAYQSSKSILLTDDANQYTKPELEIYADDVKCSHGASTGRLDDNAMFYLRARGIGEADARLILLQAFARDVIENVTVRPVRDYMDHLLTDRLS